MVGNVDILLDFQRIYMHINYRYCLFLFGLNNIDNYMRGLCGVLVMQSQKGGNNFDQ